MRDHDKKSAGHAWFINAGIPEGDEQARLLRSRSFRTANTLMTELL
jgi:hypothetical protein